MENSEANIRADASTNTNEYMYNIYKNSSLELIYNENNYSIMSKYDIKHGELLVIEHALTNSAEKCVSALLNNQYLYETYFPRDVKFEDRTLQTIDDKILYNSFKFDEYYLLVDFIAKFNHSCNPNASVVIREHYVNEDTVNVFVELYAIRNISKGTELTISYGSKESHKRADFKCNCGKSLSERRKISNTIGKLVVAMSDARTHSNKMLICKYLESSIGKTILFHHYLVNKGIFINKNTIGGYTEEGAILINDITNKYLNFQNDEIKNDDRLHSTSANVLEVTPTRLNLFLQIINDGFLIDD